ncbi:MAG: hypothetical protein IID07_08095 [Gemmatimonadetes bacterium]|nr:hypothetical protein [Gemmatimonadota bacterium]
MLFSLFHGTGGSGAFLEWRIGAFSLSAALGLAGIFLDVAWLVMAALIVLIGGLALRALMARDAGSTEQESTVREREATEQEPTIDEQGPTIHGQEPTIHE